MLRAPRQPAVWFSALACWFGVLWYCSTIEGSPLNTPPFPHFDKVQHFGYFLIGGFLLAAGLFRRNPQSHRWKRLLITTTVVMAAIGGIDEWHQCFTPGRSGGDPWDWLADLLGGGSGALLLKAIHQRLQ